MPQGVSVDALRHSNFSLDQFLQAELLHLVLEFLCKRRKRIACICHLVHRSSLLLRSCRDGLRIIRCLARDVLDALQRFDHVIPCLADNTNCVRSKANVPAKFRKILRHSTERLTRGRNDRGSLIDVLIPLTDGGNSICCILLNEANEVGNVLCRLARLLCELADFLRVLPHRRVLPRWPH